MSSNEYSLWIMNRSPIAAHLVLVVVVVRVGETSSKSPRLCHFKSDWDEIWRNCSLSICASIDGVQDGNYAIISRRKMLPRRICPAHTFASASAIS